MADVSVEFGAKDTGLENTLKTVQDELARLDEKVKGGELSFNELQSTMKKVAQAEKLKSQLEGMAQATGDAGNAAGTAAPKVDEIGKQTKQAGKEAEDFGEKSKGGFLKMSGAVAAGQLAAEAAMAGIRAAINLAKGTIDEFGAALDLGGRLSDLAARTGEAEGNLLLLERAFTNTGASAEQVGPVINKLQKFMEDAAAGGAAQTAAMERLGLSYDQLAGKTPTEQMQIFADRISAIEEPGQRAAAAMGVFGEEGAQLIPLLTNFSGSIGTAKSQLGGMVEIMNTNAATFNEVGKKIDGIKGKFMEFAAGILSRIVPALDAITEGLSRIDAAAIGQKLADAFLGGQKAMQGFQAAVDAFSAGNISDALMVLWQSIKVQAMQTANEIYKNLESAFKTAVRFGIDMFSPSGAFVQTAIASFAYIGAELVAQMVDAFTKIENFLPGWFRAINPHLSMVSDVLTDGMQGFRRTADEALTNVQEKAGGLKGQIVEAATEARENFNTALTQSGELFSSVSAEAAKLAEMQNEISLRAQETTAAKQAALDLAPLEASNTASLLEQEKQRLQNELAASAAKADAAEQTFAQIENEIELNNAIASGNEQEIKRVQEKQKQAEIAAQIKANEESIPAIIEDIIAKTGTSVETATQMAEQLIASKNAALGISATASNATTNFNNAANAVKSVKEAIDAADKAKMDNPPKSMNERLAKAQESLSKMKDFIGEDMNKMSLADIMKKMGLSAPALMSTDEKLKMVEEAVKKLQDADPADLTPTVDKVGVNDKLEAVKAYLAGLKAPDTTPHIDQEKLKAGIAETKKQFEGHLSKFEALVVPKFDTASLQEQIDVAVQSSKGTEHLSNIDKLVVKIQELVAKIEGKLPMQALAY